MVPEVLLHASKALRTHPRKPQDTMTLYQGTPREAEADDRALWETWTDSPALGTLTLWEPLKDPLHDLVGPQIATAIRRESTLTGIPVPLILGIIRTENPWLKPDTVNSYGAVGLMQVVPRFHLGSYPKCGTDLTDIDTNVCYGVRILIAKIGAAKGDTTKALLFYNGCWGETYVEGCERYSTHVRERGLAALDH
jgi:soluble lytic murein transglycosylase-like protein